MSRFNNVTREEPTVNGRVSILAAHRVPTSTAVLITLSSISGHILMAPVTTLNTLQMQYHSRCLTNLARCFGVILEERVMRSSTAMCIPPAEPYWCTASHILVFEERFSRSLPLPIKGLWPPYAFTFTVKCLKHYHSSIANTSFHPQAGVESIIMISRTQTDQMHDLPYAQLSDLSSALHTVSVIRYTAASALVASIWDVGVTFDNEVDCIWSLPFGPVKVLFFFVRYGNVASLMYVNYVYSGITHPSTDGHDCLKLMSIQCIWDRRKNVKILLCVALVVVQVIVFVLGGKSVASFARSTSFAPAPINTCVTFKENKLVKVAFGCALLYDVFVIILATCNALDRPRRPQHKVITDLHRDGAIWFCTPNILSDGPTYISQILFVMRLINFLFFMILPPTQVFSVLFLTWALISMTLSRMMMRIEATKRPFVKGGSRRVQVKTWVPARDMFELEQSNWVGTSSGNTQE
ncbi:hypothetical protein BC629DRAFT_1439485 [Irpex lacteus]|nr:hypothetical protein BC629DRAFT_1439485 [Irpex lacteus]